MTTNQNQTTTDLPQFIERVRMCGYLLGNHDDIPDHIRTLGLTLIQLADEAHLTSPVQPETGDIADKSLPLPDIAHISRCTRMLSALASAALINISRQGHDPNFSFATDMQAEGVLLGIAHLSDQIHNIAYSYGMDIGHEEEDIAGISDERLDHDDFLPAIPDEWRPLMEALGGCSRSDLIRAADALNASRLDRPAA